MEQLIEQISELIKQQQTLIESYGLHAEEVKETRHHHQNLVVEIREEIHKEKEVHNNYIER